MSEPHHSDKRRRDEGTVLLATLLSLALMSAVALALLAQIRTSITRTSALNDRAQADLYAIGARDFAQAQLDAAANLPPAARNALIARAEPILLPYENGMMSLRLYDGSHCLRLGTLGGPGPDAARMRLQNLMTLLDVPPTDAARLSAAALDWVDADDQPGPGGAEDGTYLSRTDQPSRVSGVALSSGPHRTANTVMASPTELRSLSGMTEPIFRTLAPHVCTGPSDDPMQFNIDTAEIRHAPVLGALLGGDQQALILAASLITDRPSGGYGTTDAFMASPSLEGFDTPAFTPDVISFTPDRVVVEAVITYGSQTRTRLFAFSGLDKARATLTYRDWGPAAVALSRLPGSSAQEGRTESESMEGKRIE